MLEKISGYTVEEAKDYLLKNIESEVTHDAGHENKGSRSQIQGGSRPESKEYITLSIQRCAADHVAEATVSVVPLPNDEMKGE